jgi:hypothetical protein
MLSQSCFVPLLLAVGREGRGAESGSHSTLAVITRRVDFLVHGAAVVATGLLLCAAVAKGELRIVVDHNDNEHASPSFTFKNVPAPARGGAGSRAKFILIDGERDQNGGDLKALSDGQLPEGEDEPSANFFFKPGTDGGRLLVDLEGTNEIKTVRTYSWHPGTRGPQVYALYGSDGQSADFNGGPKKGTDPATVGWKLVAKVDTRSNGAQEGGQYGVHIFETQGSMGTYRYLLFDISQTENADAFGNTFYSEIQVIDSKDSTSGGGDRTDCVAKVVTEGGDYKISIDTCETPDLTEWSKTVLAPVVREWYPKLVKLLPSPGFEAPKDISIRFSATMRGVAATGGTRIRCAAAWFRTNLKGEAVGSVVHELVHVVQSYGSARRNNPEASPSPGWLVEGIADYIRWFLYEPQSHGADIEWMRHRKNLQLRHDAGYRVTANFLNFVSEKRSATVVQRLNAAMREGKYREDIWQEITGRSLQDLSAEWKSDVEQQLASGAVPGASQ